MPVDLAAIVRADGFKRRGLVRLRPVKVAPADELELLRIYNTVIAVWTRWVPEVIRAYDSSGLTTDADGEQLQWLIDQIAREADQTILYQTERLGRWVSRVGVRNATRTISSVKSATGVDIEPFIRLQDARPYLEQSIRQNVAYLKNVSQDTQRRVEQAVYNSLAQRWTKKRLTDEIAAAMGITKRRARVIAGDQTHKLNAALNRYRNQQLGIDAYKWRTMRDERVRPKHRAREGRTFRWDDPPDDGHPGHPVACRCSAEAILDMG